MACPELAEGRQGCLTLRHSEELTSRLTAAGVRSRISVRLLTALALRRRLPPRSVTSPPTMGGRHQEPAQRSTRLAPVSSHRPAVRGPMRRLDLRSAISRLTIGRCHQVPTLQETT